MLGSAIVDDLRTTNARGERAVPRSESECILHMLDALERSKNVLAAQTTDLQAQHALRTVAQLERSMAQLWLGGSMTQSAAVAVLREAVEQLQAHTNCQELSALAEQLVGEAMKGKTLAQRHDNTFGRMFESALVKQLVDNPSAAMLKAAFQVKQYLMQAILAEPPATYPLPVTETIAYLAECLREDARPWHAEVPELQAFLAQPNAETLVSLMSHPVPNGYHMVLTYWIAAKISANLPYAPWMEGANKYYGDAILKNRSTLNTPLAAGNVGEAVRNAPEVQTRHYGTALVHQPKPDVPNNWRPQTNFPARVGVNIHAPSAFEQHVAESNQSTVHGVSGTTNMLTYLLLRMNAGADEGTRVSVGDALAGNMAFLVMDGGHSIPEAMATSTSILAEPTGLDGRGGPESASLAGGDTAEAILNMRQHVLNTTTANYAGLARQRGLGAGETSERLAQAVQSAFSVTRTGFRTLHAARTA